LSSIYKYILFKIKAKENNSSEEYEFDIPHLKSRIERRIKRSFREFEGEIEEISEEIIKLKQKFLDDSIEKCYKKWKANT
jgi:CRISPR/Cas system CSM-associated protein Csm2 small subunit